MWYNEQGDCTGFSCWPFNPDIVLVDSEVVARAPVRSFVAGTLGDRRLVLNTVPRWQAAGWREPTVYRFGKELSDSQHWAVW